MKTISNSEGYALPMSGESKKIFSGTALDLSIAVSKMRAEQTSFDDFPRPAYPIELLQEGDITIYGYAKTKDPVAYRIEEIRPHGADENQRVVVATRLIKSDDMKNRKTIFNARYLPGEKTIDLTRPTFATVANLETVVASRQKLNAAGGYPRKSKRR